jgi:hypothetical protein
MDKQVNTDVKGADVQGAKEKEPYTPPEVVKHKQLRDLTAQASSGGGGGGGGEG